jgi:hypothetical protein
LKRASELDDMAEASTDTRATIIRPCRELPKMAAQEIRVQEAMAGKK